MSMLAALMRMGFCGAGITVSFIGSASAAATSLTPSAHQVGDLLIAHASRDASTTAPTLPSGWTNIANGSANGAGAAPTVASRLCYKFATSTSETCTGFTNATTLICHVYRNVSSVGASATGTQNSSSTTFSYPALTLLDGSGSSWVAAFVAFGGVETSIQTPPAGMTNRSYQTAAHDAAGHDTNGGVSSVSSQSVTTVGNRRSICYCVELRR